MLPGYPIQYAAGSFAFVAGMSMFLGAAPKSMHVLITEFEVASTLHQTTYLAYTRLGWVRKRGQFMLPTASYFACTDGTVVVAAPGPRHWQALAMACDQPELAAEGQYGTFLNRRLFETEINPKLEPWFAERSSEEAFSALCEAGVPAAIVKTFSQAEEDPQFAHRNFLKFDSDGTKSIHVPFLLNGVRPGAQL